MTVPHYEGSNTGTKPSTIERTRVSAPIPPKAKLLLIVVAVLTLVVAAPLGPVVYDSLNQKSIVLPESRYQSTKHTFEDGAARAHTTYSYAHTVRVRRWGEKAGEIHGRQVIPWSNGQLTVAEFEDGEPVGLRTFYDDAGVVITQWRYEKGRGESRSSPPWWPPTMPPEQARALHTELLEASKLLEP